MEQNGRRPVFLNLFRIRLPVGGVASIVHRISGVLLVLLLPVALYLLQQSLTDPAAYARLGAALATVPGKLIVLVALWLLAQHFFSGLRHLLMDIDIGMERTTARRLAWLTFAASGVTVVLVGICL